MALVLSRKPSEEILIGDNIRVSILGVRDGKTVSVAVTAPKDVPIVRAEVSARNAKVDAAEAAGVVVGADADADTAPST